MNKLKLLTSEFPEINKHLKDIAFLKTQLKRQQRRLKSVSNKYDFLNIIIGEKKTGKELERAIAKLFKDMDMKM
ncbi:MAG: hypothetical protein ABIJ97_13225 [Bacteroidota bacterium]